MKIYKTKDFVESGKSIHLFSERGITSEVHAHDFIEIIYILSGEACQLIDGIPHPVRRGDLLFINYGSKHAFQSDTTFEYINICFSPDVVSNSIITPENAFSLLSFTAFNELCNDSCGGKLSFLGEERQEIENILFAMLKEYRQKQLSYNRALENYLDILITKMLRTASSPTADEESDEMWRDLLDYIDENLDTKLTLSLLARKCFYNPSYFSRIFKEKFKMPLTEYISRKRVEMAAKLLLETSLPIDEIYLKAGFSDKSNFYCTFSKLMGNTPYEYRKSSTSKESQKSGKNQG